MGLDIVPVCLICLALLSAALGIGAIFLLGFVLLKRPVRKNIANFFHHISVRFEKLIDETNVFAYRAKQNDFSRKANDEKTDCSNTPVLKTTSTVLMKDAATSITVDKCEQADMTAQEDYDSDTDSLTSYLPYSYSKKSNANVPSVNATKLNSLIRTHNKRPTSVHKKKPKHRLPRKQPCRVTVVAELCPEFLENTPTVKSGKINYR
uniref:Nematode cuticle collagen N-terminal domain-containing protein n=1 Tax=Syphacia muris TaxID=451379 RepID=A0A0N5AWD7_9BILA